MATIKRKLNQLGFTQDVGVNVVSKLATRKNLSKYLWNLPPHEHSLPVDPAVDPLVVQTAVGVSDTALRDNNSTHPLRRGRIYWYSRVDAEYTNSNKKNTGKDPRYGFQFLWNPTEITTAVSVNLDITPTSEDKFAKVVGAFPSGEMLTVTAVLDRTNDFFSIKSLPRGASYNEIANKMVHFYQHGSLEENFTRETVVRKIKELQKYGTLADIEYLYKAINGPGWKNIATNRESSDIGFLAPTLLKIELGPISYIGYVNDITVNHTTFTKSMIPIRSTVSISFNLMATAGLSTTGV